MPSEAGEGAHCASRQRVQVCSVMPSGEEASLVRAKIRHRAPQVAEKLLSWFQEHKRSFPWREGFSSREKLLYATLIAELLLRKTKADQAAEVFPQIIGRWPNPCALHRAEAAEIERTLKPLGIYKERARLFKKLAEELCAKHNGSIPLSERELLALPGVGKYAANAVMVRAGAAKAPMLDTNFIRFLKRVFSVRGTRAREREDPVFWSAAAEFIKSSEQNPLEVNWAVLDFGALVCTTKPQCERCLLKSHCDYYIKQYENTAEQPTEDQEAPEPPPPAAFG